MKIKTTINFILLFVIYIFLTNCQHDDTEEIPILQQSKYKIETLNKNQLIDNEQVVIKLNKFLNSKDLKWNKNNAREIYNSDYGFTINTDYVKYLENTENGYHSYSFPLTRDSISHNKVENLLLSLNPDGNYDTFIVTYGFSKEEFENIDYTALSSISTTYTPIDFDTSVFNQEDLSSLRTTEVICIETWNFVYIGESSDDCEGCDNSMYMWVLESRDCTFMFGSSGTSSTGTGNNGDGSSSGGSNDGTDQTEEDIDLNDGHGLASVPAVDQQEEFDEAHQKNCNELHNFSTNPYSQNEFNSQEIDVTGNKEKGFILTKVPFNPGFNTQPIEAEDDCGKISFPINDVCFGFMHTHPTGCIDGTHPMFFEGDLYTLYRMSQTYNVTSPADYSIFTAFMTVENYHYAIKINDINKFNQLGDIFNNKKLKKDFRKDYKRAFEEASNTTTSDQVELSEAFLKFINETYDLGISLYRSSHDDVNYDPNLPLDQQTSNWKKLILDEYGNLDFTNC